MLITISIQPHTGAPTTLAVDPAAAAAGAAAHISPDAWATADARQAGANGVAGGERIMQEAARAWIRARRAWDGEAAALPPDARERPADVARSPAALP